MNHEHDKRDPVRLGCKDLKPFKWKEEYASKQPHGNCLECREIKTYSSQLKQDYFTNGLERSVINASRLPIPHYLALTIWGDDLD